MIENERWITKRIFSLKESKKYQSNISTGFKVNLQQKKIILVRKFCREIVKTIYSKKQNKII